MEEIGIIFLVGVLAATIGSFAGGGGGFLPLNTMLFFGVPLNASIATNKFGDMGMYPFSIRNFLRARKIPKKFLRPVIVSGILGGILGALLMVTIPEILLKIGVSGSLLYVLYVFVQQKKLGLKKRWPQKKWKVAYFWTAVYDGFVGSGGGIFSTYVLCKFGGRPIIEANALNKVGGALSGFLSLVIVLLTGIVQYKFVLPLFLGNLIGGYVGSKFALYKGNVWVRAVLMGIIVLTLFQLWIPML